MINKEKMAPSFSPDWEILSWKTILTYRSLWMSAAIILIILFHAPYVPFQSWLIDRICVYGYGGVDIFLFSSGIGCFFSYNKNPDILGFLKRRLQRIMPVFLMSLAIWTVYCCAASSITLWEITGNIFGYGTLANQNNQLNWYFACLWLCYFSTPFFVALLQTYSSVLSQVVAVVLLTVFSFSFFNQWTLILWSRIPIFFVGMCIAQASTRKTGLSVRAFALSMVGMVAGVLTLSGILGYNKDWLWNYGCWWYPFILITPGLCFLLSAAAHLVEKTPLRHILRLCMKAGEHTLSLSLVHVIVFEAYSTLAEAGYISKNAITICIAVLLVVAVSIFLEKVEYRIQRRCQ